MKDLCQNELIIPQNNLLKNSNKIEQTTGNVPSVIMITILLLSAKEKERLTKKAKRQKAYRKKYIVKEKLRQSKYYHLNKERDKEKIKERDRLYRINNLDKIRNNKRKYQKENRLKLNKYKREKLFSNIHCRIKSNLRSRITRFVNGRAKTGSAIKDLGCSIQELKTHLESKFQKGMTWNNYGAYRIENSNVWHIDHIKPLASFDLTNKEQFLQACHYTNLQPLWAIDNIKKSDKIVN